MNLFDLEHVLSTSVSEVLTQKSHWKTLSDQLFERNNMLRRNAMDLSSVCDDREATIARLEDESAQKEKEIESLRDEVAQVKSELAVSRRGERQAENRFMVLTQKMLEQSVQMDLIEVKHRGSVISATQERTPRGSQSARRRTHDTIPEEKEISDESSHERKSNHHRHTMKSSGSEEACKKQEKNLAILPYLSTDLPPLPRSRGKSPRSSGGRDPNQRKVPAFVHKALTPRPILTPAELARFQKQIKPSRCETN